MRELRHFPEGVFEPILAEPAGACGKTDGPFEQARGVRLNRATVGDCLACELRLNLGCDVNLDRHESSPHCMPLSYRDAASRVNKRAGSGQPTRMGLTTFRPAKSLSLSVTRAQSFTSATAAMIMSSGLRGRPGTVPPAISRAQTRAAFSSNGRTRPANRACGPSGPANQRSSSLRFFPAGFSSNPRRISATVREVINRSSSDRPAIHATRASDGMGLATLLMILVSRRYRSEEHTSELQSLRHLV